MPVRYGRQSSMPSARVVSCLPESMLQMLSDSCLPSSRRRVAATQAERQQSRSVRWQFDAVGPRGRAVSGGRTDGRTRTPVLVKATRAAKALSNRLPRRSEARSWVRRLNRERRVIGSNARFSDMALPAAPSRLHRASSSRPAALRRRSGCAWQSEFFPLSLQVPKLLCRSGRC